MTMNNKQRDEELDALFNELTTLFGGKGIEYANDVDVLANFKRGDQLGLTPEQKLSVYLDKHISSIYSYIKNNNKVFSNEPITGRINDAIAYLFLLRCLIKENDENK